MSVYLEPKRAILNSIGCERVSVKWKFDACNRYLHEALDMFFNEHYG